MRLLMTALCALFAHSVWAESSPDMSLDQNRRAAWFAQDRSYTSSLPGVVNDADSGLLWQRQAPDYQLSWSGANTYCAELTLAGIDDWRLPTRLELLSLLNYDKPESAYDSALFNGEPPVAFWSGTVYDNMPSHVWIAQFGEGDMYCLMRVAQAHVRCVA